MKCLFAYNPVSGKGKINKKLDYIVGELKKKYEVVDVYATQHANEMPSVASSACGKYDALIFSGGDGTVNEVISGIAEKENKPILGYIPTGTINDVARSLKIKRNIKKALKVILQDNVQNYDILKLNDRYAMYAVACGAMTTTSYMTSQEEKHKIGKIAYGLYALKNDFKFEKFKVKYSYGDVQGETEAILILVINSKSVSSFNLHKDAVLDDGIVDFAIVQEEVKYKELGIFRRIRNFVKSAIVFLFGYKFTQKNKHVITFSSSNAKFEFEDNIKWNFDGEKGVEGDLTLQVLQQEIPILVPKKKEKNKK